MTPSEKRARIDELQEKSLQKIDDIVRRYRADVAQIMAGVEKRTLEKLRAELGI
jgi:hypothetical protein